MSFFLEIRQNKKQNTQTYAMSEITPTKITVFRKISELVSNFTPASDPVLFAADESQTVNRSLRARTIPAKSLC